MHQSHDVMKERSGSGVLYRFCDVVE